MLPPAVPWPPTRVAARGRANRGATPFRDALGAIPSTLAEPLGAAPDPFAAAPDTLAGFLGAAPDPLAGFLGAAPFPYFFASPARPHEYNCIKYIIFYYK